MLSTEKHILRHTIKYHFCYFQSTRLICHPNSLTVTTRKSRFPDCVTSQAIHILHWTFKYRHSQKPKTTRMSRVWCQCDQWPSITTSLKFSLPRSGIRSIYIVPHRPSFLVFSPQFIISRPSPLIPWSVWWARISLYMASSSAKQRDERETRKMDILFAKRITGECRSRWMNAGWRNVNGRAIGIRRFPLSR